MNERKEKIERVLVWLIPTFLILGLLLFPVLIYGLQVEFGNGANSQEIPEEPRQLTSKELGANINNTGRQADKAVKTSTNPSSEFQLGKSIRVDYEFGDTQAVLDRWFIDDDTGSKWEEYGDDSLMYDLRCQDVPDNDHMRMTAYFYVEAYADGTLESKIKWDFEKDSGGAHDWTMIKSTTIKYGAGGKVLLRLVGATWGNNMLYIFDYWNAEANNWDSIDTQTNSVTGGYASIKFQIFWLCYDQDEHNSFIRPVITQKCATTLEYTLTVENPCYGNNITLWVPEDLEMLSVTPELNIEKISTGYTLYGKTAPITYTVLFASGIGYGQDHPRENRFVFLEDVSSFYLDDIGLENGKDFYNDSSSPITYVLLNSEIVARGVQSVELYDIDANTDYYFLKWAFPTGKYTLFFEYYIVSLTGTFQLQYYNISGVQQTYSLPGGTQDRWVSVFKEIECNASYPAFNFKILSGQCKIMIDSLRIYQSNIKAESVGYNKTQIEAQLINLDGIFDTPVIGEEAQFTIFDASDSLLAHTALITDSEGFATFYWNYGLSFQKYLITAWASNSYWRDLFDENPDNWCESTSEWSLVGESSGEVKTTNEDNYLVGTRSLQFSWTEGDLTDPVEIYTTKDYTDAKPKDVLTFWTGNAAIKTNATRIKDVNGVSIWNTTEFNLSSNWALHSYQVWNEFNVIESGFDITDLSGTGRPFSIWFSELGSFTLLLDGIRYIRPQQLNFTPNDLVLSVDLLETDSYFMFNLNDSEAYVRTWHNGSWMGDYFAGEYIPKNQTIGIHEFGFAFFKISPLGVFLPTVIYTHIYEIIDPFLIAVESFYLTDLYCNLFVTGSKSGTYQIFENNSQVGSGTFQATGTAISHSRNLTAAAFIWLAYKFINGSEIVWFNTTYNNAESSYYRVFFSLIDQLGKGLPWETLKIYSNGSRQFYPESLIKANSNLTITAYDGFDILLFNQTYTISEDNYEIDIPVTLYYVILQNSKGDYPAIVHVYRNNILGLNVTIPPGTDLSFPVLAGLYDYKVYYDKKIPVQTGDQTNPNLNTGRTLHKSEKFRITTQLPTLVDCHTPKFPALIQAQEEYWGLLPILVLVLILNAFISSGLGYLFRNRFHRPVWGKTIGGDPEVKSDLLGRSTQSFRKQTSRTRTPRRKPNRRG